MFAFELPPSGHRELLHGGAAKDPGPLRQEVHVGDQVEDDGAEGDGRGQDSDRALWPRGRVEGRGFC